MNTTIAQKNIGTHKVRLAVVGASGFIGSALCQDAARHYETIAITRSPHRASEGSPGTPVRWHACDFFSRSEMNKAVAGADYGIYLVHTRVPTARLDQVQCEDMDILQADNFARAALQHKVRQIIYLSGLIPEGNASSQLLQNRNEVVETLGAYGTPVTVLRTSLVVGPGSTALKFLGNIVRRSPIIIVPKWALTRKQPIALYDLIKAIRYCLGNTETFGRCYDIGGPDIFTVANVFEQAAQILNKKRSVLIVPVFPRRLYTYFLRLVSPETHPDLIRLFVEGIQHHTIVSDNPLQRVVLQNAVSCKEALEPYLDHATGRLPNNPRHSSIDKDRADFVDASSVRSIQRIPLPPDRDSTWLADYYFTWLPRLVWPFVKSQKDNDGSWHICITGIGIKILSLTFSSTHSSADRRMYFITGGLLAKSTESSADRMEFRDVSNGRSTIVAIHDFKPFLPWRFYNATQATMHGWVMKAFQSHMRAYVKKHMPTKSLAMPAHERIEFEDRKHFETGRPRSVKPNPEDPFT